MSIQKKVTQFGLQKQKAKNAPAVGNTENLIPTASAANAKKLSYSNKFTNYKKPSQLEKVFYFVNIL